MHNAQFYRRVLPLILFIAFHTLLYGQAEELRNEINKLIKHDTEIEFDETPGFIIGIIDRDSCWILDFGYADKENVGTLNENSVFELGSLSKPYMASLIAILNNKEIISYESKINDLLPLEFSNKLLDKLTIGKLLNHTSGFPKLPTSFGVKQKDVQNPYNEYSKQDLLTYYRDFIPLKRKKVNRGNCLYSHLNYAILELVLENILEETYEEILKKYLLSPLNLNNTFIGEDRYSDIVPGYDRTMKKVKPWIFNSFAGSEGIKSSIDDLKSFIEAQLDQKSPYFEIFQNSHEIEVPTSYNKNLYIGKSWHVVKNKGHYNIINHTGKTTGHQSFAAFVKETGTAVVILCNSSHGVEDLGFLILRMINYNWRRKS